MSSPTADRELVQVGIRCIERTPTKPGPLGTRDDGRPILGVGCWVNALMLCGADAQSHERYAKDVLFTLQAVDRAAGSITIRFDGGLKTITNAAPSTIASPTYGRFDVAVLRFMSQSQLRREAQVSD